jgi:Zn finger protein HypA/HybF involved in hydrogenase expression
MARFCCRACNSEGTFEYNSLHGCPNCGSRHVQIALSIKDIK